MCCCRQCQRSLAFEIVEVIPPLQSLYIKWSAADTICLPGDFQTKAEEVKKLAQSSKKAISLVIADSNYGVAKRGDPAFAFDSPDQRWGETEFSASIDLVQSVDGTLDQARWVWFLTEKQFPDALTTIQTHGLAFKSIFWCKGRSRPLQGASWGHGGEHIWFVWKANDSGAERFVERDPDDPDRYYTYFYCPPVATRFSFGAHSPLNKYQKPIAVHRRLQDWAPVGGLIVDITCGSGTTAVGT